MELSSLQDFAFSIMLMVVWGSQCIVIIYCQFNGFWGDSVDGIQWMSFGSYERKQWKLLSMWLCNGSYWIFPKFNRVFLISCNCPSNILFTWAHCYVSAWKRIWDIVKPPGCLSLRPLGFISIRDWVQLWVERLCANRDRLPVIGLVSLPTQSFMLWSLAFRSPVSLLSMVSAAALVKDDLQNDAGHMAFPY